jgi:hypothetical protein
MVYESGFESIKEVSFAMKGMKVSKADSDACLQHLLELPMSAVARWTDGQSSEMHTAQIFELLTNEGKCWMEQICCTGGFVSG